MRSTGAAGTTTAVTVKKGRQSGRILITAEDPGAGTSETFHPGSYIEWWFFHGSCGGRTLGTRRFMASLFRYDHQKTGSPDSVGYYFIASILDPETGHTDIISRGERSVIDRMLSPIKTRGLTNIDPLVLASCIEALRAEGPAAPVTLEPEPAVVTAEPFSFTWKDIECGQEAGRFRLAFNLPGTTTRCTLTFRPESGRYEMHGIGATLAQPMAYATIPRLSLTGRIGDEEVTGDAWFDHQWGSACWFLTRPAGGRLNGWDWIAVSGNDGSDWIFLVFHDMQTRKVIGRFGVLLRQGEPPRTFTKFDAAPLRFWESRTTHVTYPVAWTLEIPELSARITVSPDRDDQEIPVLGFMRAVWEGAATAEGTVNGRQFSGRARVELQGYGYIFDFREFLEPYFRRIREDIGAFFPSSIDPERYRELAGDPHWLHEPAACNELIARPFWDMMSRKKKFWRPVFGMLLLESLGIGIERYRTLISVVPELTHTGTLIIDDIEDNATSRRGDACIHSRYGLDVAINAANTLYFLPAALYSIHPDLTDRQRLAFYRITLDAYVRGHLGQALDIFWTKNLNAKNLRSWQAEHLPEKILQMYEFKTASTAIVIAEACCILDGSDEERRRAAVDLARNLGVAFQILNDVGDFEPVADGGECGGDLAAGKLTYVMVRALGRLSEPDRIRLTRILCSKRLRKDRNLRDEGIRLVQKSGAIGCCRTEARMMAEKAWNAFSPHIPPSEHKLMLLLFLRSLVNGGKTGRRLR